MPGRTENRLDCGPPGLGLDTLAYVNVFIKECRQVGSNPVSKTLLHFISQLSLHRFASQRSTKRRILISCEILTLPEPQKRRLLHVHLPVNNSVLAL